MEIQDYVFWGLMLIGTAVIAQQLMKWRDLKMNRKPLRPSLGFALGLIWPAFLAVAFVIQLRKCWQWIWRSL
jgi:hypothetical protein